MFCIQPKTKVTAYFFLEIFSREDINYNWHVCLAQLLPSSAWLVVCTVIYEGFFCIKTMLETCNTECPKMIHSARSTISQVLNIVFEFFLLNFEEWGRTDNMCENNDHYRPCLWVGREDQYEYHE